MISFLYNQHFSDLVSTNALLFIITVFWWFMNLSFEKKPDAWSFILTIQESEDKGICINEWLSFGQKSSPQKVHVIV